MLMLEHAFDPDSNTYSYLIWDSSSRQAAIIDPVLEFDSPSGRTAHKMADHWVERVQALQLQLQLLLETHVHADHLSASPYLKAKLGGRIAIGKRISEVQQIFVPLFNATDVTPDGRCFDLLLDDNQVLPLGELSIQVLFTPGHTPACVSYLVADAVFVGDTLFMPDYGSARCDFPGGDAATLYQSVQRLFALPDSTRMFLCHDYQAPGRTEFSYETTVAAQKAQNIHLKQGTTQAQFVEMRQNRDKTLSMPKLMLPSVQVNMRAGQFPPAEDGKVYLKLPVNLL
ncbi:MBL fold metallo-hydrolase [Rheinheimera sp.]|uniref:MBL fold metallo-hydrolase n=1 Tax=Rheinheimera sp. TaxID=1869214 RepID=UPI00307E988F